MTLSLLWKRLLLSWKHLTLSWKRLLLSWKRLSLSWKRLSLSGEAFSGRYEEYYGLNTDTESLVYLMLANHMLHDFYPFVITIAEVGCHAPGCVL